MSLTLESRPCGSVLVVRCAGRIISGEDSAILEATLQHALRDFTRVVLNVEAVSRVDSAGMGLLVRFLWHARNHNGDLRLACPQSFFTTLLNNTKLASVFRVYPEEEAAIVSFLQEGAAEWGESENTGPRVLFLDPSPDTCAFVRTFLSRNGYRVLSTGLMGDAKILLSASTVDVIVLGPDSGPLGAPATLGVLRQLAPNAKTVVLEHEFKSRAADEAGVALLERIQAGTRA